MWDKEEAKRVRRIETCGMTATYCCILTKHESKVNKSKAFLVTGRRGLKGCETSRIQNLVDIRLRDGGDVVRLTRRQRFTPQEDFWFI
jgi:hypothetical protein